MANDNLSFISYNVKGIQQSSKRIKVFEYLKNNSLPNVFVFFCKRHTPPLRMKSNGMTMLRGKYFTLMVQQILAVLQLLLFLVQNL